MDIALRPSTKTKPPSLVNGYLSCPSRTVHSFTLNLSCKKDASSLCLHPPKHIPVCQNNIDNGQLINNSTEQTAKAKLNFLLNLFVFIVNKNWSILHIISVCFCSLICFNWVPYLHAAISIFMKQKWCIPQKK